MEEKTLLQRLLDAGYPESDIFHHCSDLYVYVTPLTAKIVSDWCKEHKLNKNWNCPIFTDRITGRLMYDCAFQYYKIPSKNI